VPRRPTPGRLHAGRSAPRADSLVKAKGASVKQLMDSLVAEMIDKGILFTEARREFEKRFILRVLQRHRGNLSRAAKDLKIHRNTLGKKIDENKIKVSLTDH
jgi:Fis family transcriptional regulator, factor for inversion stimulation protein